MRHTREEVIQRTIQEFDMLDALVANLSEADWQRPLARSETKDPWTVKDALAHITHWKADVIRAMRRGRRPAEERGLNWTDGNRLVYLRWRDRSPQEVLAWHRQVAHLVRPAPHAPPSSHRVADQLPCMGKPHSGHRISGRHDRSHSRTPARQSVMDAGAGEH